jgi:V8-like Glu-specific endopeptidase
MRQIYALIATLVLTFSVGSIPASAITDGALDGNGHPYVGLMVAQTAAGQPLWRCSGTLISATLFLTAGHCTEAPAGHVEIWFDADVESGIPGNGYPFDGDVGGTPYTHPQYDPNAFYLFDLGVVVLDKPVKMKTYGKLPALNANNTYADANPGSSATYTAVGYGLQKSYPSQSAQESEALRIRMVANPYLVQIDGGLVGDFSLLLSNNAHSGGTCFGDSGGPNFIGSSNVIGGVTSFGLNGNCAGTGGVYRVDKSDDLNWLATFN